MKKLKIPFVAAVLVMVLFGGAFAFAEGVKEYADIPRELVVLHTNDYHGHPLSFYDYPADGLGGLPAIATFVKQARGANPNVLVLDAGDLNTGRPESNFFKAEPDILGYNYIGYDAMTLGNHEFDKPLSDLKTQMSLADFPFISANVKKADGSYLTQPYIINDVGGIRVAVFGLTTKETEIVGSPDIVKGLVFEDEVTAAKSMVAELDPKSDLIIALVHMGLYSDNTKGSRRLAANVPGIDLIIDGHTHTYIEEPLVENGVPIVQAKNWGMYVGMAKMTVYQDRITKFSWKPVPINLKTRSKNDAGEYVYSFIGEEYKDDPILLAKLKPYADKVEAVLSEVIGRAETVFLNDNSRKMETEIGDLVSDSMLWYTKKMGADFAIQNGGGIRTNLNAGNIQKKNVYEILPFDNSVMIATLKGTDVQAMFDFIATIAQGAGAFPQVSEGVRFTINYDTGKCENITINGSPIDPNRTYKVTTNSYMAAGGDGYAAFKKAAALYDTSAFQRDVVIEYIQSLNGAIKPEPKGRINIIGSKTAMLLLCWNLAA